MKNRGIATAYGLLALAFGGCGQDTLPPPQGRLDPPPPPAAVVPPAAPAPVAAAVPREAAPAEPRDLSAGASSRPAGPPAMIVIDGRTDPKLKLHPDAASVAAAVPAVRAKLLGEFSGLPEAEWEPLIRKGRAELRTYLAEKAGLRRLPALRPAPTVRRAWQIEEDVSAIEGKSPESYRGVLKALDAAQSLLATDDPDRRQVGLRIARSLGFKAIMVLDDPQLAAAIADAFLIPDLDAANPERVMHLSAEGTIRAVMTFYIAAGMNEKVLAASLALVDLARSPSAADFGHMRAAQALELMGRHDEALAMLDEISRGGQFGAKPMQDRLRQTLGKQEET